MLEFKKEIFVSPKLLTNYKQITGREAINALKDLGLTHVTIMDDGKVGGLDKQARAIHDYYVYEREVPVFNKK